MMQIASIHLPGAVMGTCAAPAALRRGTLHRAAAARPFANRSLSNHRENSFAVKASGEVRVEASADARIDALEMAVLEEELMRRAGRKCELCEGWKGGLQPYKARENTEGELPQLRDHVLVCSSCKSVIDVDTEGYKPRHLNFLKIAALSDVPVVMELAVNLLEKVTGEKVQPLVCGESCQKAMDKETLDMF